MIDVSKNIQLCIDIDGDEQDCIDRSLGILLEIEKSVVDGEHDKYINEIILSDYIKETLEEIRHAIDRILD